MAAVSVEQQGMEPPPPRAEPKRDRWGRYLIPDPATGEERSWIRATTWAASVADSYALTQWQLRQAALGFAQRRELMVGVAAVLEPESTDGQRQLDKLIRQAQDFARANERSTLGTALHSFCEAVDTGRQVPIPEPFDKDIAAYRQAMRAIKVSRNYVEKIGLVHELGVAGTMDRVVAFHQGKLPMIGDIKTGKDLKLSWTEIVIQLALYAHSDTVWDAELEHHRPMLEVDKEKALVVHLPAGEARCQLYLVDIEAGWEMAQLCGTVRAWRARQDLAELLVDWSPKVEMHSPPK